jgi:hypothetical protein
MIFNAHDAQRARGDLLNAGSVIEVVALFARELRRRGHSRFFTHPFFDAEGNGFSLDQEMRNHGYWCRWRSGWIPAIARRLRLGFRRWWDFQGPS